MAQALPDGIQHILWVFSHMLPELADANVDIKAHHVSGSANLNLMCTAAEPSDNDTGGNGDGDGANSQSMLTPLDATSDVSESIVPSLAGFVHMGLCMAAFLLVIPSSMLVVRYGQLCYL